MPMGLPGWKRGIAWTLVAVCAATAASLHRHESLADLVGEEYSSGAHAVTSHIPLSSGSHLHRLVRWADDDCLACHSQRTAAVVPAGSTGLAALAATCATSPQASDAAARFAVTRNPRGPPALL